MSQLTESNGARPSLALLAARKAGHAAITVIVCIVIWAVSSDAGGYFWPGWVILIAGLDFLIHVGKAVLGDAKEREQLEQRYGGSR
jgi:hypothetical protein